MTCKSSAYSPLSLWERGWGVREININILKIENFKALKIIAY